MAKFEFDNPMADDMFKDLSNQMLAEIFAKKNVEGARKLMDKVGYPRWFVSNNPAIFSLNLFKAGAKYLDIVIVDCFTAAVSNFLNIKEQLSIDEIEEDWNGYYKQVRAIVGEEKSRKILKEKSNEETQKELDDLLKIEL